TVTGLYFAAGNRTDLHIRFVLGTTSTAGSGALTFSTPTTPSLPGVLKADLLRGGVGYTATSVTQIGAPQITPYGVNIANKAIVPLFSGDGIAGPWAATDEVRISGRYFALSS